MLARYVPPVPPLETKTRGVQANPCEVKPSQYAMICHAICYAKPCQAKQSQAKITRGSSSCRVPTVKPRQTIPSCKKTFLTTAKKAKSPTSKLNKQAPPPPPSPQSPRLANLAAPLPLRWQLGQHHFFRKQKSDGPIAVASWTSR